MLGRRARQVVDVSATQVGGVVQDFADVSGLRLDHAQVDDVLLTDAAHARQRRRRLVVVCDDGCRRRLVVVTRSAASAPRRATLAAAAAGASGAVT